MTSERMVPRVDAGPPPWHICRHMATTRTTILADPDLLDRVARLADRQRTTRTALITAALEAYLAEHEAAPGPAVPRGRAERARPPVARRSLDRAPRGQPPAGVHALAAADPHGDPARRVRGPRRRRHGGPQPRRRDGLVRPGRRAAPARCPDARGAGRPPPARARAGGDPRPPPARSRAAASGSSRRRRSTWTAPPSTSRPPPSIGPRLADALLVAVAERLGVRRIATFDRRPIAVFRPRHVRAFDLEP